VTTVIGISSFIVTLGTFFLLNGLNLVISDGTPRTTPGAGSFATVMGGGTYSALLWAVGFALLLQVVLTKTRTGSHTIATGGNAVGAAEAGIRVRWVKVRAFMLASAFAGFAGILEAVRVTSIDPLAGGATLTFQAISAIVIGGTLLTGGVGTVIGSFVGAVFLGVLRDGFTLAGVNAFAFDLIVGMAIIVAMVLTVGIGRLRRQLR
jgi:simple sugar transport system permease protein